MECKWRGGSPLVDTLVGRCGTSELTAVRLHQRPGVSPRHVHDPSQVSLYAQTYHSGGKGQSRQSQRIGGYCGMWTLREGVTDQVTCNRRTCLSQSRTLSTPNPRRVEHQSIADLKVHLEIHPHPQILHGLLSGHFHRDNDDPFAARA